MSPDAWQVIGIAALVIMALIGAIYGWLVWNQRRLGKNIHGLRTVVQRVILTLASKGIIVRSDDDERG
jgi:hypothetical protein